MTSRSGADRATLPAAASTLLADLLAGDSRELEEVARTRVSVHYDTGDPDVPVLCVATPEAVRLPNTLVTPRLPARQVRLAAGVLSSPGCDWKVARWWRPARPVNLTPPPPGALRRLAHTAYDDLDPMSLVGRGRGLTPEGDDVLAGALVTAHATGHPRSAVWRRDVVAALAVRRTTAVSRALLQHALDGYAVPELADALVALCSGGDAARAVARLRGLGHSSGTALLDGALHVLTTTHLHEGAA